VPRIVHRLVFICALISALALPSPSQASEGKLRYDLRMDLAVTAIATAGWAVTWGGVEHFAPAGCRWCDVNAFDDWGRRNIKWSDTSAASRASDALAYAAAPMAAYGMDALAAHLDGDLSNFWVDALVITEAVALSQFATQLVKIAVGRQRPYAHYGAGSQNPRDNISFYSGHTSLAFSLAVASGTVAQMRGYKLAPAIWATGLAVAATTSYLRLAADKHYLTDTIAGAVLGSAFGFAIPYLFHRPRSDGPMPIAVSAAPTAGGALLVFSGNI